MKHLLLIQDRNDEWKSKIVDIDKPSTINKIVTDLYNSKDFEEINKVYFLNIERPQLSIAFDAEDNLNKTEMDLGEMLNNEFFDFEEDFEDVSKNEQTEMLNNFIDSFFQIKQIEFPEQLKKYLVSLIFVARKN